MSAIRWVQLHGSFHPDWAKDYGVFAPFVYRAEVESIAPGVERTLSIEGSVQGVKSVRAGNTRLRERTPFDHGGHLIAVRFGGPNDRLNLVPMHGAVNVHGPWYRLEDEIDEKLNGRQGVMRVLVGYETVDAVRPKGFHVDVTLHTGERFERNVGNYAPYLRSPHDPRPR